MRYFWPKSHSLTQQLNRALSAITIMLFIAVGAGVFFSQANTESQIRQVKRVYQVLEFLAAEKELTEHHHSDLFADLAQQLDVSFLQHYDRNLNLLHASTKSKALIAPILTHEQLQKIRFTGSLSSAIYYGEWKSSTTTFRPPQRVVFHVPNELFHSGSAVKSSLDSAQIGYLVISWDEPAYLAGPIKIASILMLLTLLCAAVVVILWPVFNTISQTLVQMTHCLQELAKGRFDGLEMQHPCLAEMEELQEIERSYTQVIQAFRARDDLLVQEHLERESALCAQLSAELKSESKSKFIANISHELRTPLGAIIGYSELINEDILDNNKAALLADVEKIRVAGVQLLGLINDILELTKIESGKLPLSYEYFNLVEVLTETTELMEPLMHANRNVLQLGRLPSHLYLYSDEKRVRQILNNLLGNAAKYTDSGSISVTLQQEFCEGRDWAKICVADTGIGMEEVQLRRIFEPFTQADESATRVFDGGGLGLALSRRYSELLGGGIEVQSELDQGSQFWVKLPCRNDAEFEKNQLSDSNDPALLWSAQEDVEGLICGSLAGEGGQLSVTTEACSAILMALQLQPKVILVSENLAPNDFREFHSALRLLPTVQSTPVILLRSQLDLTLGNEIEILVDGVLHQPFTWTELFLLLEQLADGELQTSGFRSK